MIQMVTITRKSERTPTIMPMVAPWERGEDDAGDEEVGAVAVVVVLVVVDDEVDDVCCSDASLLEECVSEEDDVCSFEVNVIVLSIDISVLVESTTVTNCVCVTIGIVRLSITESVSSELKVLVTGIGRPPGLVSVKRSFVASLTFGGNTSAEGSISGIRRTRTGGSPCKRL
jgi:hypothetical protein